MRRWMRWSFPCRRNSLGSVQSRENADWCHREVCRIKYLRSVWLCFSYSWRWLGLRAGVRMPYHVVSGLWCTALSVYLPIRAADIAGNIPWCLRWMRRIPLNNRFPASSLPIHHQTADGCRRHACRAEALYLYNMVCSDTENISANCLMVYFIKNPPFWKKSIDFELLELGIIMIT